MEVRGISKHFGGVTALDNVSLKIYPAEVLALVGDNGAGKSTLIKIMAGALRADSGEIYIDGRVVSLSGPKHAKALGIETVYQDLALCDNLDAPLNVFLGRYVTRWPKTTVGILNKGRMRKRTVEILSQLGAEIEKLEVPVRFLSGGQRQAVAIGRAVYSNPRLVILDEPTAALGVSETQKVLSLIKGLKKAGIAVIFISHTLQEVFEVADRVVILRNGRKVGDKPVKEMSIEETVRLMIG